MYRNEIQFNPKCKGNVVLTLFSFSVPGHSSKIKSVYSQFGHVTTRSFPFRVLISNQWCGSAIKLSILIV